MMNRVLYLFSFVFLCVFAPLHETAFSAEPPLAIRNATIETLAAAGRIEKATVVIRDGKIVAVGKDVAIPVDATVIDAEGGTVMPGIIDPYFEVTIAAGATPDAPQRAFPGRGGRGMGGFAGGGNRASAGFIRVSDNFYPYDAGFKPLPRVGVTRLNLVTNGMGQAAVVRVTPADPDHMMDQAEGIAFVTVTSSTDSLDQVRNRLESAARAVRLGTKAAPGVPQPAGVQLWSDVYEGKVPLVAHANTPAAVLHLLKATEQYKLVKLVFFLAGDAIAETVPALKERSVRVIVRPGFDLMPNTRDRFSPARMLRENGIDFLFSLTARPTPLPGPVGPQPADETAIPTTIDTDFPLFPVAMMVKTGLTRTEALEALVKKPAILLGLEKTHGTIETGKSADLLLFTGDPLDPSGRLRRTIIDGRTAYAY